MPLNSLVEVLSGQDRLVASVTPTGSFADCRACDNRAVHLVDLRGSAESLQVLFERARTLWQRDIQQYLNSDIDPDTMSIRRKTNNVRTMEGLEQLLNSLE